MGFRRLVKLSEVFLELVEANSVNSARRCIALRPPKDNPGTGFGLEFRVQGLGFRVEGAVYDEMPWAAYLNLQTRSNT